MPKPYSLSETHRLERAERMKRLNADPLFAAKRTAAATETLNRLNPDPKFAEKRAAGIRAARRKAGLAKSALVPTP